MKKVLIWVSICAVVLAIPLYFHFVPNGITTWSKWTAKSANQDMAETKTEVEKNCRTWIADYETQTLMYEQYRESSNADQQVLASAAKQKANEIADKYNDYFLRNKYVWDKNIPSDIWLSMDTLS